MQQNLLTISSFIENLPIGVVLLDPALKIVAGNKVALDLLHIPIEELITNSFDQLLPDHAILSTLERIRLGETTRSDFCIERENRTIRCSIDRMSLDETPNHSFVILLENGAKYANLDKLKQEFVQTILHMIRTPLSTVKTSLSLVTETLHPSIGAPAMEIVSMCLHETNRLVILLNDLRNLYYIETGLIESELYFEVFTARRVLGRAIADYTKAFGGGGKVIKEIRIEGDQDTTIKADFEKLKQVLAIILKNASDYSPGSSFIDIVIASNESATTIEIKDYGIGIAESSKGLIFSKFFREDNAVTRVVVGNGLGLFIAYSLVEKMNGALYFESCQSKGTSFFIAQQKA